MAAPTVLLVDDDQYLRTVLQQWLTDRYDVRIACDGAEALEKIDEEVDLVLLDRRLPDVSGKDVLGSIRQDEYDCQVAMLTAVDPDFDILEMECDEYLVKPVTQDDILSTVQTLLDRRSFDELVRERYALSSKLAALEANKPRWELATSEDYHDARRRLERLGDELDRVIDRSVKRQAIFDIYRDIHGDSLDAESV